MFLLKVRGTLAEFFLIILCSEEERRVDQKSETDTSDWESPRENTPIDPSCSPRSFQRKG